MDAVLALGPIVVGFWAINLVWRRWPHLTREQAMVRAGLILIVVGLAGTAAFVLVGW